MGTITLRLFPKRTWGECYVCRERFDLMGATVYEERACSPDCAAVLRHDLPSAKTRRLTARRRRRAGVIAAARWSGFGHKERARQQGTRYERINGEDVYERDGWVCGICRRKIDRRKSHPDPLSASLDHVVPLSRGGSHTWGNVQAAHLACNINKGAGSAGSQLSLEVAA